MAKKVTKKSTPSNKPTIPKAATKQGVYLAGPDEFNVPPDNIHEYMMLLYGAKGIGKSTLAASFPDAYTFMTETMRRNLRIRMSPLKTWTADQIMEGAPDTFEQVKELTAQALEDKTIKTLIFDSIDLFYDMVVHSQAAKWGVSNPSMLGKESSGCWIQVRNEFKAYMDLLAESHLGVVLLSHAKEREVETITGDAIPLVGPSCAPACFLYIKQACDIALYYGWHNDKRTMVVRDPSNQVWCANGTENKFMQPNGKPLRRFNVDGGPSEGFDILVSAFNNEMYDADYTPPAQGAPKKKKTSR